MCSQRVLADTRPNSFLIRGARFAAKNHIAWLSPAMLHTASTHCPIFVRDIFTERRGVNKSDFQ